MRLLPDFNAAEATAPEGSLPAAAPVDGSAPSSRPPGPVLGADPLARPAPPRAHRRSPGRPRRALALPPLRLRRQRRPDPPLRRHPRFRARRGVRHLQSPPRADRPRPPGAPRRRCVARPGGGVGIRRLGPAQGAAARLWPTPVRARHAARPQPPRRDDVHPCAEREHGHAEAGAKRRRDDRARRIRVRGMAEAAAGFDRLPPGRNARRARRRVRLPAERAFAPPRARPGRRGRGSRPTPRREPSPSRLSPLAWSLPAARKRGGRGGAVAANIQSFARQACREPGALDWTARDGNASVDRSGAGALAARGRRHRRDLDPSSPEAPAAAADGMVAVGPPRLLDR